MNSQQDRLVGFYDSGVGGLSVLKEWIKNFGSQYQYIYLGDSARAPYGEKTKEQLIGFICEIFDFMKFKQVDCVISACNTSSMYLDQIDLSAYPFKVVSLFDVMRDYFKLQNLRERVALLATPANIDSKRYLEWAVEIYPVKCPTIVPLVENNQIDKARLEWQKYLQQIPKDINKVIIGCTHYSFLVSGQEAYDFIDPANLLIDYIQSKNLATIPNLQNKNFKELDLEIYCTGNTSTFDLIAKNLLNSIPNLPIITLNLLL